MRSEIKHDKEGFFGVEQAWYRGATFSRGRGRGGVINVNWMMIQNLTFKLGVTSFTLSGPLKEKNRPTHILRV